MTGQFFSQQRGRINQTFKTIKMGIISSKQSFHNLFWLFFRLAVRNTTVFLMTTALADWKLRRGSICTSKTNKSSKCFSRLPPLLTRAPPHYRGQSSWAQRLMCSSLEGSSTWGFIPVGLIKLQGSHKIWILP